MLKSKQNKRNKVGVKPRSRGSKLLNGRLLEIVIAVAFGVVVLFVISMSIKITGGVSQTIDAPDHEVRLQVLNGCGVGGLAGRVADELADYTDEDLKIVVVETANFDLRRVEQSFLISRENNTSTAELLARKLGLDDDDILVEPLENNYREVSATLVLGSDWQDRRTALISDSEK